MRTSFFWRLNFFGEYYENRINVFLSMHLHGRSARIQSAIEGDSSINILLKPERIHSDLDAMDLQTAIKHKLYKIEQIDCSIFHTHKIWKISAKMVSIGSIHVFISIICLSFRSIAICRKCWTIRWPKHWLNAQTCNNLKLVRCSLFDCFQTDCYKLRKYVKYLFSFDWMKFV